MTNLADSPAVEERLHPLPALVGLRTPWQLLREAADIHEGPTVLRIPKGTAGPDIEAVARTDGMDILHRTRRPLDVLLIPVGSLAAPALDAAQMLEDQHGVGVTVADPRWVLPVNPALTALAARHRPTVALEDGPRSQLLAEAGLDAAGITRATAHALARQQDASPSTDVSDRFPVRKRSSR